ncbi:uncharacterized protein LOC34620610 [Cyclospora cayetanensis]|uniref:Uncharacterized protein LOC34620610 n=2 Tax=Cyclospora cayetanensis TaxID=88456 RepID=A0A6P5WDL9_9EIME|nr:uncharacterized protein LOC34620610 [Cyclospora cayetanensis]OEH78156.1 hypothetical protein cyc_04014 [Cyclospora cayetanensis]
MASFFRLFSRGHFLGRNALESVTAESPLKNEAMASCVLAKATQASVGADPRASGSSGLPQLVMALFVIFGFLLIFFMPVKDVLRQVVEFQRSSPTTYVLTYIVAGLGIPAPLLSVLAGVLMGPSLLAVFVIIAGSLGSACFAFLISRFMLRELVVQRFVMRNKRLQAIDAALRKNSLKLVMCTRMVLPFTFNNYFLGTTSITLSNFALSTFVTGIPFAVVYAIIGGELQSLDDALAANSFELKSTEVNVFGICTVSKRYLEITGIFGGICLFVFIVRTVKQFADRVIREAQQQLDG